MTNNYYRSSLHQVFYSSHSTCPTMRASVCIYKHTYTHMEPTLRSLSKTATTYLRHT